MPPIAHRSPLEPRGLSAGAKAGVSVGTILGSLLILLCLWPVVARFRNRRRRRHADPDELPGEGPATFAAPAMVEAPAAPADRRMSTDSYVQRMDNRLASRRSTKDLTLASSDGTDASTARAPMPPATTSVPGGMPAESPSSAGPMPSPIDVEMARMVASCESRGYSGSYYNTDIPSEAFGLTSSPTWDSQISHPSLGGRSPTRMSASTLLGSLFRKVTGPRGSSSSPSTVVGPPSPFPDSAIAGHALSESPTELEPPPNELSRSPEEQASRAVDLSRIEFPAPASPPLALPGHAPPGTVNPMQVMGAMTAAEQSWLTNAELMNLTSAPSHNHVYSADPIPPVETSITPNRAPLGISTPSPSSSESTPEPGPILEDVSHSQDYASYTAGVEQDPEPQFTVANGIPDVTIKTEPDVPITAPDYMRPVDGQVHQYTHQRHASSENPYYTDHSTYSTPFPAPSPSGASTLNTPDTRITDTSPSPKPMTTPEIKQSSSPNPRIPLSPQSPQILVCDKCGQKFDQPHKLKYVAEPSLSPPCPSR